MPGKERPMTFAQKLKFLTAGKNRAALCKSVGISDYAIDSYIAKGNLPNAGTGLKIARVLGVSMDWLFDPSRGIVMPEDARSSAA